MGFHLPFGDDKIPTYDAVAAVVTVVVIAGLVAWAIGWI